MQDRVYTVSVIGFNRTEQIVLNSIFALSARRTPRFTPLPGGGSPDLYLVDGSSPEYLEFLQLRNPHRLSPSIVVGDNDGGTGWPVLARPLQWARLFKAFDLAVEGAPVQDHLSTFATGLPASEYPIHPPSAAAAPAPAPTQAAHAAPANFPSNFETPTVRMPQPAAAAAPSTAYLDTVQITPQRQSVAAPAPVAPAPAAPAVAADQVLVVDDNLTVREFMAQKLRPFAFDVEFAENGEKALYMCSQKHYTCVFLDVVMPGMDGYQVCKHVKSKRGVKKTNVVMLTSKSSPFDKIRGAMAGCDAYLTKPVDEEKLLTVIAKFLPGG